MAADKIASSNFGISLGETKTFGIKLFNECTNYVGFQMDLTLPDGLTVNKSGCSLTSRIIDENQELTIGKQGDNTYRLISTSFSLTPIDNTSGDLINVSITASDTYQGGNATISNIQFATSNSERVTMDDVSFAVNYGTITFADEQVKALCVANWDTNGDGELDMSEAASVTDLGQVFNGKTDITSFDELQYFTGLTNIGGYAFKGCTNLTSIVFPNSVTSIRSYAFWNCSSLSSITFPDYLKNIYQAAFAGCSSLTSVTIPNSVTYIERWVFGNCSNLTSITVESENTAYDSRDNCNAIIEKATSTLIQGCQNTVIPNNVTSIITGAFEGCSGLTSITIPNSVTSIGDFVFYNCTGLTSVTISNNVTKIASSTFGNCSSLTSVNIPNSVTSIGSNAFEGCTDLATVTIGNSVTSIGGSAFSDCTSLTSIEIPNSVTSIDNGVFAGCSGLISMKVESENTKYDSRDDCNAIIETASNKLIAGCKNSVIPNSVTSIGNSAFSGCSSLISIDIPNSVTSIGNDAFWRCSGLTSITIPNSVTNIGWGTFQDCTALTLVYIGNSVTNIGERAFQDCSSLTSVVVNISSPLTIPASTFNTQDNATLFVPKDSRWSYASAEYWKEFKTIKEFPDPDVNQDGYVDVVDVVDVARFVVGTPSDSFVEFLADLNGSGDVNVADAVVLVNEIAGDVNWSRPLGAAAVNDDILTLTRNVDQSLSFSLEGNSAYTAFQFDLMIPEGMDVTQMTLNSQRKQNHMLLYNKIGEGHYRVVVLSTSNQSFNETVGELLCIGFDNYPADGIIIDDIHFVTPQGNDLLFSAIGISGDTPTSISSVRGNNCEGKIYNLNGQSMTKTQKGLYIINGKKVVVK